uniref:NADH-ubiquinone oxidoreductase chain 1 n=2 Tax=Sisoridae TaxID=30995 RepID=A0A1S5N509_BAGYA|nr:NADH dehydrogenase subunit 1 [Pareuchiloglanis gracilicaudata]AFH37590.1 NADH dehydrogenase subunit 1 [Pareuchiloglanis gracilicaudata]AJQ21347.1 NADH dehydrogenase subunit 1 [Bagarius yarrelli]
MPALLQLLHCLTYIISVLLGVAFLTLIERKILGYMQLRKGPNVVGPWGIFQPLADAAKLFTKEPVRPSTSSPFLFVASPALALTLAMMLWSPLPMPYALADLNLGALFIMALSSLAVYSILGSGWASNSKYALIGALRAVAQTISYEISLGLILLAMIMFSGDFNMQTFSTSQETTWFALPAWPLAAMWYVSTLAETNRAPFDLTEGESELVSGFNVEYAGGPFALFFLAEYANILMMNTFSAMMFMGTTPGLFPPKTTAVIMAKSAFLAMTFLWVRASYPRFRYDQLMHLAWKSFLPAATALILWHTSMPVSLSGLPPQM